ncbi:aminoglycoside phosphotransferase family protein [Nocardioidaceae bacterium SCSIO 66511]|nr:aminoglycoside phosphotransferase family protein [Nocardioidaceae bacterium SCSIO 66511]
MQMHADQLYIDEAMGRRIVDEQFPHWRSHDVRAVDGGGTVNAIFRIGERLAARFPLQGTDPEAIRRDLESDAEAAAEFATLVRVPTPEPVAIGEPSEEYPLPWSAQTWLPGTVATVDDPAASVAFAEDLAALIEDLRAADVRGRTYDGSGRGGHLPDHDEWLDTCFAESEGLLDVARLRTLWADLRTLPENDPDAMCHKDLIPPNLLVSEGRLAGVLDCGDFAPADPALDLVAAWHLLDKPRRRILRDLLGCDDVQWARGMAWAFQQAMGLVWYYRESNPSMSRWGRRTLERILGDRDD